MRAALVMCAALLAAPGAAAAHGRGASYSTWTIRGAEIAVEVQRVQQEYDAQVQSAENPEDLAQLQQQAQQDAQKAIEDQGMSLDEYTAILQAANQDPQLYAMIVETMEQRGGQ